MKAILKALNVKIEVLPQPSNQEIPPHVAQLMDKPLKEAEKKQLTSHVMIEIRAKLKK